MIASENKRLCTGERDVPSCDLVTILMDEIMTSMRVGITISTS